MNDFVPALLKEMDLRADYLGSSKVGTVYIGGGTPSLLDPAALNLLLNRLRKLFILEPDPEITLEANPDDMTDRQKLNAWRSAGINRLSVGVQSFFDDDLRWMNRAHDAAQAADAIRLAQDQGLDNISIDLIYGGPTLPDDRWESNVRRAIGLEIPHLSCYALTVEPRTSLDKMIRRRQKQDVDPDDQARQLLLLMEWTAEAGYEHYEISNFARPGRRSRHNSAYWQGIPYLGLGPSAHSYDGASRQWNIANNAKYITALAGGHVGGSEDEQGTESGLAGIVAEREILTSVQRLNEYIMISLRMMEGCDFQHIKNQFGKQAAQEIIKKTERYVLEGKAVMTEDRVFLTSQGKLLADRITADLFMA